MNFNIYKAIVIIASIILCVVGIALIVNAKNSSNPSGHVIGGVMCLVVGIILYAFANQK